MKTIKHFLLTLAVLLCNTSLFAEDFEVNGVYYNITSEEDLTVWVTYRGEDYEDFSTEYRGSITIPETVTYSDKVYRVTGIYSDAFRDCSNLISITIPSSVTFIGENAFSGTAWYNSLPDGVVYLGKVLYKYKGAMTSGTSIEIEEGTVSISGRAFYMTRNQFHVTIPNSVTTIGYRTFYHSDLTSVTIPNSITSIGKSVFEGCTKLTSVTIPNSVTSIGEAAFANCKSLKSITIPNSVTSIAERAFDSCI